MIRRRRRFVKDSGWSHLRPNTGCARYLVDQPSTAQRCGARTRGGSPCRQPAMKNGRCRLHGGEEPWRATRCRNGNYRHGLRTMAAMAQDVTLSRLGGHGANSFVCLWSCRSANKVPANYGGRVRQKGARTEGTADRGHTAHRAAPEGQDRLLHYVGNLDLSGLSCCRAVERSKTEQTFERAAGWPRREGHGRLSRERGPLGASVYALSPPSAMM
jgi:hypothetical protein